MLEAARRGAGVEIDLRTTADDRVVLLHDLRLLRTTDGHGLVSDTTAAQIRKLRTDDGQWVPFLRQALMFVRDRPHLSVVLDLKAFTPASTARMVAIIADVGVESQISVISFRDPLIEDFREVTEGMDTFNIRVTEDEPLWDAAVRLGSTWVMTDDVDAWRRYCPAA